MIERLINLLFPRRAVCMGCGSMLGCERDDICDECRERLAGSWVGVERPDKAMRLDGAAYAYRYHGVAGNLVRRLKYGSVGVLAEEMGIDLARAALQLRIDNLDMIVPVPMHPRRQRQRGYNQSILLAEAAAKRLGVDSVDALMRTRDAVQQVKLDDEQRRRNLEGVFAVRPEFADRVRGGCILLVDDVRTTGTTAKECAAALREAGAGKVYFAAYAAAKSGENRRKKNG